MALHDSTPAFQELHQVLKQINDVDLMICELSWGFFKNFFFSYKVSIKRKNCSILFPRLRCKRSELGGAYYVVYSQTHNQGPVYMTPAQS